jgi:YggT family protein
LVEIVKVIITLLTVAIFARVVLSFIVPLVGSKPHPLLVSINSLVNQITEPVLAPLRRVLPTFGMFDFSPMVALVVLLLIRQVVVSRL